MKLKEVEETWLGGTRREPEAKERAEEGGWKARERRREGLGGREGRT